MAGDTVTDTSKDTLVSHGQTLFSCRGIIAFSMNSPLKKGSGRVLVLRPTDSVGR